MVKILSSNADYFRKYKSIVSHKISSELARTGSDLAAKS